MATMARHADESLLIIIILVSFAGLVFMQDGENETFSYSGTDFAFSFLAHDNMSRPRPCTIHLMSAVSVNATVTVRVASLDFLEYYNIVPGEVKSVSLALSTKDLFGDSNATVVINSSEPIGVMALVQLIRPAAAFQVIPQDNAGNQYVISSYAASTNKRSQFTITSYQDENKINISYSPYKRFECDKVQASKNEDTLFILQRHETVFCKGKSKDFTGTSIRSSSPIAVVAGGNKVNFYSSNSNKGYIMEQMLPFKAWGKRFAVAPFAELNGTNYLLRLITREDLVANVTVHGTNWTTNFIVNGTEFAPFNDIRAFDEVVDIYSNEPISVMQYLTGSPLPTRSDPSMFNVPPLEHSVSNQILVDVFEADSTQNIINIVADCDDVGGFLIDGEPISGNGSWLFNGSRHCSLSHEMEEGLHCVSHMSRNASFYVILYAWKVKRSGQSAYAMHSGLGVPADYPTCLPKLEDTVTDLSLPASELVTEQLTTQEYAQSEDMDALADAMSYDLCPNGTNARRDVADLARQAEEFAMDIAEKSIENISTSLVIDYGYMIIEIQRVNLSSHDEFVLIPQNGSEPRTTGFIPVSVLRDLDVKALVSIVFQTLGSIIDNCTGSADDTSNSSEGGKKETVGSEVLSLNLFPPVKSSVKLSSDVEIAFPLQAGSLSALREAGRNITALCSFWDYTLGGWSQEGCHDLFSNSTHVRCSCNHLTNFAVLMQVNEYVLPMKHIAATNIISPIGSGLSIAGVFLTICTFLILGLKSDRVMIHVNLAFAIGLAQVVFLCLDIRSPTQVLCSVKASLLYYFFMSSFCWMLIEGVNLYLQAVVVFNKPGSRMRVYMAIGWLCPLVPLSATLGFYKGRIGDDVTLEEHPICFVRSGDDSIWFFVVPVLAIIALNVYFVSRVIFEIVKLAGGPHVTNNRIARAKHGVRACVILLPVMGLTWVFGLMWQNASTLLFMYLFIVFNSLQGFFLFLFHCLLNSEVQNTFSRKKEDWIQMSMTRRGTFTLKAFRSDNSSKRKQNGNSARNSTANTPNDNSDKNRNSRV